MATDTEVTEEFVKQLADHAASKILEGVYNRDKVVNTKATFADLVTETDVAIEQQLVGMITEKFPHHKFLCEESSSQADTLTDAPTWIIDPIDGTTNFVHTFPFCCVSIAFARNKQMIFGCINAPLLKERYFAAKNGGAYLNDVKISTSGQTKLSSSLLGTAFNISKLHLMDNPGATRPVSSEMQHKIKERNIRNLEALIPVIRDLRCLGSCALQLAYVACGRMDIFFEFGPHEWDLAAGILLVEEAGGAVTDIDGTTPLDISKSRILAAASNELASEVAQRISDKP